MPAKLYTAICLARHLLYNKNVASLVGCGKEEEM
jgi:hypothetical protein